MWVIAKIVTSCLNHVVMACIMNQSYYHSLLFDVLTTIIILISKLQAEMARMVYFSDGTKVLDLFDYKLLFKKKHA